MKPKYEIERKWIVKSRPNLPIIKHFIVHQSYLYVADDVEVRVVRLFTPESIDSMRPIIVGEHLTVKIGNGLKRQEIELELTENQMAALRAYLPTHHITKDFYRFQLPNGIALDYSYVDAGLPTSFQYAEIEFFSEEEAEAFTPPPPLASIIDIEVTNNDFSMKNYWSNVISKYSGGIPNETA